MDGMDEGEEHAIFCDLYMYREEENCHLATPGVTALGDQQRQGHSIG
jgi:hypothetical protein